MPSGFVIASGMAMAICAMTAAAHAQHVAETPAPASAPPAAAPEPAGALRPIVGFRVRGPSKLTERALAYLTHVELGDLIGPDDVRRLERNLVSSELFEKVGVALEDAAGGAIVVATLDDKHSWIIAPTLYVLSGNRAFGVGYAENNFRGENRKILLYGQIGTRDSLFYGAYLDPSIRGSKLTARLDAYLFRRVIGEFANPVDDPTSLDIARTATTSYYGGGALLGWTFAWWAIADLRLRGAYVTFRDGRGPDGEPMALPQTDGYDFTAQARLTLDARHHELGVTWGPYLQLFAETAIPGLDSYGYSSGQLRAYHSWRLFRDHQLELRTNLQLGYKLPFHEELVVGGVIDLRGYDLEQFRGDTRVIGRAEYSFPLTRWRFLAFRAIGFVDSAYIGFNFQRTTPDRVYLPNQVDGVGWLRNNVGAGLRIYVKSVVLPLLGFDVAYGIEGRRPEIYFEVGLTDF